MCDALFCMATQSIDSQPTLCQRCNAEHMPTAPPCHNRGPEGSFTQPRLSYFTAAIASMFCKTASPVRPSLHPSSLGLCLQPVVLVASCSEVVALQPNSTGTTVIYIAFTVAWRGHATPLTSVQCVLQDLSSCPLLSTAVAHLRDARGSLCQSRSLLIP